MRRNLPYLGKRSLIAPDSNGSSSWQFADENAPLLLPPPELLTSPLLLLSSRSFGALEVPQSPLFYPPTIRTTKWKEMQVSVTAGGKRAGSTKAKPLGDTKELKSTQSNLEIYIHNPPPPVETQTRLLNDTPCKIDQYHLVTSIWQDRRDGPTGNSTHSSLPAPQRQLLLTIVLVFFSDVHPKVRGVEVNKVTNIKCSLSNKNT